MDVLLMQSLLEIWHKWKSEERKSKKFPKLHFTRQSQVFWLEGVSVGMKLAEGKKNPESKNI